VANTLAYNDTATITAVESFITFGPGDCLVLLDDGEVGILEEDLDDGKVFFGVPKLPDML